MFDPLPQVPDSNALELAVLERWEREGTFAQLRGRNRGGPRWSFIDGPVTANKGMGVHTAWGRTLKDAHGRGWLYVGHRSTEWCPRCGTSLSQHELSQSGVYQEKSDPSLFVRFPLLDKQGESVVVWTTTPWTLPANVAAAVHPEAEYGLRANGEWVAVVRYPDERFERRVRGEELVGLPYRGPFDDLLPAAAVEHRVVPWDEVSLEEGTGIVHIATGAGSEDFE